jgi:hypothetical protein
MNRKSALPLLLGLVVLGTASLFLLRRENESWSPAARGSDGKLLPAFDPNAVAAVHLKEGTAEVTLTRKDGVWTVTQREDFPADFNRVSDLLRKLWQLHALQTVEAGPSQFGRLQLNESGKDGEPSATRLELKDAENKTVAVLLLGKTYHRTSPGAEPGFGGFPVGRFVLVQNDAPQPVLIKDTLSEVTVRPEDWLDRVFPRIDNVKSLTFENGADSWTLERPAADQPWTLAGRKPDQTADPSKLNAAARVPAYLEFADVLAKDKPFEAQQTLTVTTFDHLSYIFSIGQLVDGKYPVRFRVGSDAPKERTPAAEEKPEDKERLDKEFADRLAKAEETVAAAQPLEGRTFLVAQHFFQPLFTKPADFIVPPTPEEEGKSEAEVGKRKRKSDARAD